MQYIHCISYCISISVNKPSSRNSFHLSFAVTPSIKIQEISPTSLSVVISLSPSSAQFHLQHLRLLYKREGAEQWTHVEVNAALGGTVMINNLSHGKLYSVKAVAVYPDDEEISSPEMECNMPTGG